MTDHDTPTARRAFLGQLAGVALAAPVARAMAQPTASPAPRPAVAPAAAGVACAMQFRVDAVNADRDRASARARMRRSLERAAAQLRGTKSWIGADLRLVVFPEYFLTGFPTRESLPEWLDKAVLDPKGAEYEALAQLATEHAVYLAGNAYELDEAFPGLFFQCSFVIDPAGRTILRYRRLISTLVPTPHDVWDRYLDVYGLDGVFPVARTPIGNLAAIASEEIQYPEIARAHAIRGAEVFVHSSSEAYTVTMPAKRIARLARAVENLAWVVSANSAGVDGIDIALDSANGGSEIIDHLGRVAVLAGQGETMTAHAPIDLEALRAWRRRVGMGHLLSRQPLDLYVAAYAPRTEAFRRRNGLLDGTRVVVPERRWFRERQAETLERLVDAGIVT
jgi:predicted amidohydrolase